MPTTVGVRAQLALIFQPGGRLLAEQTGEVPVTVIGRLGGCGAPTVNVGEVMVGGTPQALAAVLHTEGKTHATTAHVGVDTGPVPATLVPDTA